MRFSKSNIKSLSATGVTVGSLVVLGSAQIALAWHPQGVITKDVRNVTSGSAFMAADTSATAVSAKPGDVLEYRITIKNPAPAATNQYNDLAFIKMTDVLPAGVELVSSSATRNVGKDYGSAVVKPGQSVVEVVKVKVTATKTGEVTNVACFTANSVVKDNPKNGCDSAVVKVNVPVATPSATPVPTKTPVATPVVTPAPGKGEVLPATLPDTGASLGGIVGLGAMLTSGAAYIRSRRNR